MSLADSHRRNHGVGCRAFIIEAPTVGLEIGPRTYLIHDAEKANHAALDMASYGHEVSGQEIIGSSVSREFGNGIPWSPIIFIEGGTADDTRSVGQRITDGFALIALAGDSDDDKGA